MTKRCVPYMRMTDEGLQMRAVQPMRRGEDGATLGKEQPGAGDCIAK